MKIYVLYVTAADELEAVKIAKTVVEEHLAACANVLGNVQSFYRWDGAMCDGREAALILKTSDARKTELIQRIKQLHSYEVPCIVCLPIADGNAEFLDWVISETE